MSLMNSTHKGFTLIELLVVISIIGLLSSVVLASLNTARNKAKDAAIMQEARQLASIMHLEYSETGNYGNLQRNYLIDTTNLTTQCDPTTHTTTPLSALAGNYASKVTEICQKIVTLNSTPAQRLWVGTVSSGVYGASPAVNANQTFTIMARLNTGKWFCIGHNGQTSTLAQTGTVSSGVANGAPIYGWDAPGCWYDVTNK